MLSQSDHDLLREVITRLEERSRVANDTFDDIKATLRRLEDMIDALPNGRSQVTATGIGGGIGGGVVATMFVIGKLLGWW